MEFAMFNFILHLIIVSNIDLNTDGLFQQHAL